jgi:hypothetical protein
VDANQLNALRRQAQIEGGAAKFFRAHPEVYDCAANQHLIVPHLESQNPISYDLPAWEAAYESVKGSLAAKPRQYREPTKVIPTWPYAYLPDWRNPDTGELEMRLLNQMVSPKMYSDFYFDKKPNGALTDRAVTFRRLVQATIENENRRRAALAESEGRAF